MLIDDSRTRETLAKIVFRLSVDAAVREDLMQEAIVHLWLLEARKPNQTQSWYLQSCKFHLQNYLSIGRSIDSMKRSGYKLDTAPEDEEFDHLLPVQNDDEFFGDLSARDILNQLTGRLTEFELEVLQLLAIGMGAREIGQQLKVSHPTVIKYRRRIAKHAQRLGIYSRHSHQNVFVAA